MNTTIWARTSLIAVALILGAGVVCAQGDVGVAVSNVVAQQRPGTHLFDVTYDLETGDGLPVTVSVWLSTDAGVSISHHCQAVSGAVGDDFMPGTGLAIVWDAGSASRTLGKPSTLQVMVSSLTSGSGSPGSTVRH